MCTPTCSRRKRGSGHAGGQWGGRQARTRACTHAGTASVVGGPPGRRAGTPCASLGRASSEARPTLCHPAMLSAAAESAHLAPPGHRESAAAGDATADPVVRVGQLPHGQQTIHAGVQQREQRVKGGDAGVRLQQGPATARAGWAGGLGGAGQGCFVRGHDSGWRARSGQRQRDGAVHTRWPLGPPRPLCSRSCTNSREERARQRWGSCSNNRDRDRASL